MEDEEDDDHDGEAGTVLQVVDSHLLNHGHHYDTVDSGWSIFKFGFVDFYDSALTAIAFLTFGIFTLQVFINLITNSSMPKMGILVSNTTAQPPVNKRRSLDLHQVSVINSTEKLPTSVTETVETTTKEIEANSSANFTNQPGIQKDKIQAEKEKLREEMHNFTTHVISLVSASEEAFTEKPTFELIKVDEVIANVDLEPDPEPTQHEPPQPTRMVYSNAEEVVAKFALVTLRAVLKMDDPRCLHAALCRANRATLQLEGPPRLWLPMWR